ncbi:MAG TPA: hypothetical protein VFE68_14235 [Vicinamibacteria bacterium]|nr:hypothetical protein [Vicinamibacteria bacterium]
MPTCRDGRARLAVAMTLAVGIPGCGGASSPSSPATPTAAPPVTRVFASNLEWIDAFTTSCV